MKNTRKIVRKIFLALKFRTLDLCGDWCSRACTGVGRVCTIGLRLPSAARRVPSAVEGGTGRTDRSGVRQTTRALLAAVDASRHFRGSNDRG